MELRIDRLLEDLRDRPADILAAIDADPVLIRRESGGLVLANAGQELFTPQHPHQLYAKGIVYRRDPYRLVSLPLLKVYNLGERNVTVSDLAGLTDEAGVRLRFLHKLDGSLVQRFQADGRVWFTTRGMIEGATMPAMPDGDEPPTPARRTHFDFLGSARRIAAEQYPALLDVRPEWDGVTLVFEFIHPDARVITDYGDRRDLVLLAAFDRAECRYRTHDELRDLAASAGLSVVPAFSPTGETLDAQLGDLLASLAGTDHEGAVLAFERGREVVYRVKVKSPDYIRLLRLMTQCTYSATVAMLDARPELRSWPALEAHLHAQGSEKVPEEVLAFYREHLEQFLAYLADVGKLGAWATARCAQLVTNLGGRDGDPREFRKRFAALAGREPVPPLIFSALDGRLDEAAVRRLFPTPEEAAEGLRRVGG